MSATVPLSDSVLFDVQRLTQTIVRQRADALSHAPAPPARPEDLRELVLVALDAPASVRQLWQARQERHRAGQVVVLVELLLLRVLVDNWLDLLALFAARDAGRAPELTRAAEELRALRAEIVATWPGLDQLAVSSDLAQVESALANGAGPADTAGGLIPGLDPERARQAVRDLDAGEGRPLAEVMERLRQGWQP
jgi:hypothetical protein